MLSSTSIHLVLWILFIAIIKAAKMKWNLGEVADEFWAVAKVENYKKN